MKNATLPSLRVDQGFREQAESVLNEGETLSAFMEEAVRYQIQRRTIQREFIAKAMRAKADAERTGIYHSAEDVLAELREIIDNAKQSKA